MEDAGGAVFEIPAFDAFEVGRGDAAGFLLIRCSFCRTWVRSSEIETNHILRRVLAR